MISTVTSNDDERCLVALGSLFFWSLCMILLMALYLFFILVLGVFCVVVSPVRLSSVLSDSSRDRRNTS